MKWLARVSKEWEQGDNEASILVVGHWAKMKWITELNPDFRCDDVTTILALLTRA